MSIQRDKFERQKLRAARAASRNDSYDGLNNNERMALQEVQARGSGGVFGTLGTDSMYEQENAKVTTGPRHPNFRERLWGSSRRVLVQGNPSRRQFPGRSAMARIQTDQNPGPASEVSSPTPHLLLSPRHHSSSPSPLAVL